MYAKLENGQLVKPPHVCRRDDGTTVVGYEMCDDLMLADGYLPVVETERPGPYYAASYRDDGDRITQVWTASDPPPIPEPTPALYPDGIETPVVVLQSQSQGYGIGIVADDDGGLATYVDHQSPRPDAATIKARVQAAIAERKAERANFKALLDALASGDAKAVKDAAKAARKAVR